MQIVIKREVFTTESTIGRLYVDGHFFGFSLEDVVRKGDKVHGQTAIPTGTYKVIWNKSNRFSKRAGKDVFMPLVLDVPGFAGIRIHSGNRAADSDGCILVGYDKGADFISRSRDAVAALYKLIQSAKHGVTLTIS